MKSISLNVILDRKNYAICDHPSFVSSRVPDGGLRKRQHTTLPADSCNGRAGILLVAQDCATSAARGFAGSLGRRITGVDDYIYRLDRLRDLELLCQTMRSPAAQLASHRRWINQTSFQFLLGTNFELPRFNIFNDGFQNRILQSLPQRREASLGYRLRYVA